MKKPHKPYTKTVKLQFRCNVKQTQEIMAKAQLYNQGNVSQYILEASLNYRPIRRVEKCRK